MIGCCDGLLASFTVPFGLYVADVWLMFLMFAF